MAQPLVELRHLNHLEGVVERREAVLEVVEPKITVLSFSLVYFSHVYVYIHILMCDLHYILICTSRDISTDI